MKLKFLLMAFTLILTISKASSECLPSQDVCKFTFIIEERLTMHWLKVRVEAANGTLYRFDESPHNIKTQVPTDEVITMDGVHRLVTVVNNTIPGPPIIVYEGQQVIVHVINKLLSEAVTIHWHGLHQKGTPFMDGVAFVTQCPIDPGQSFTYKFKAYPSGTFFYHSHIQSQRVDGLFGALIIKPKRQKDNDPEDLTMIVGDWFHEKGSELHAKMLYANFKSQPGFIHPYTLDGVRFAPVTFTSAHIEGRGRYRDPSTGEWTAAPLKVYNVQEGKRYRFRLIAVGMIYPFRISIDNHMLMAIASDGFDFEPRYFESIIINPGERFDFIITANQTIGNYWIRADSMEVGFPHHYTRAILRYDATMTEEPTTNRMKCTPDLPCMVLNCQFSYFPKHENSICVTMDQLHGVNGDPVPEFDEDSEEYFMNFVSVKYAMSVNGYKLMHTPFSSLTQDKYETLTCDKVKCENVEGCKCNNELKIPFNKTIQMVWTNHGVGADRHHPIHLHGHSFHVLKIGYGRYNATNGVKLQNNDEIECIGKNCFTTKWKDSGHSGNKIPGLKIKNRPQKDTLMLPAGAYAIIRFRSDNPGKWLMHCHIEFHAVLGMSMIINEAPEHHIRPPRGFPVCHDFLNDEERDWHYEILEKDDEKLVHKYTSINLEGKLLYILLSIFLLENLFVVGYCTCWRKRVNISRKNHEMQNMVES